MTKKLLIPMILLLTFVMSACGSKSTNNSSQTSPSPSPSASASTPTPAASPEASGTITYQSETGPVEVPANPKRIVALTNAPNVLSLGGTLVGVDEWTNKNPLFTDKLKGIQIVSDEDLEKSLSRSLT